MRTLEKRVFRAAPRVLKYDDAIARVDALDRTLRRLEIDGSDRALAAAANDLDAAQGALRTLVAVGCEPRGTYGDTSPRWREA